MSVGVNVMTGPFKLHPVSTVIADNVKRMRQARCWSQVELARRSGVSRSAIKSVEGGINNPLACTVWHLAGGLEVSVTRLMMDAEAMERRAVGNVGH